MGSSVPESKYNKFIDFSIKIEKICYFPGENINGTIYLMGKPGLNETQFKDPKTLFIITERQKYDYPAGEGKGNEEINKYLYNNFLIFNNFSGANLLTSITIPFSIKLSAKAKPSVSIYFGNNCNGYIRHFLVIEIPFFKVRRVMAIIVKNAANFTKENKLLKIPGSYSAKKSKSKFLSSKGNFSIDIKLAKNVFYYDEPIPFEVYLDCKNLNLEITKLEVSLIRQKRQNYSSNLKVARNVIKEIIAMNIIIFNQNLKEYVIKNSINYPKTAKNDGFIYLPKIYASIESNENLFPKKSIDDPNKTVTQLDKKYHLAPSCINSLVSVDFILKFKLYFKTIWTYNESFHISVDFCSRPDEKHIQDHPGQVFNSDKINSQVPNLIPNMNNSNQQEENQMNKPLESTQTQNQNENTTIETMGGNHSINESQEQPQNININESDYNAPPPSVNENNYLYNPNET